VILVIGLVFLENRGRHIRLFAAGAAGQHHGAVAHEVLIGLHGEFRQGMQAQGELTGREDESAPWMDYV